MSEMEDRIEEIFGYANIRGNLALRILLDDKGGIKTYLTNDFDEPPTRVIELHGEKEEKVFNLFRYPDLNSNTVKQATMEKIHKALRVETLLEKGAKLEDIVAIEPNIKEYIDFKEKYFGGSYSLFEVRSMLREKYKPILIEEAKDILNIPRETQEVVEQELKPVYKSRTIIGNIFTAILIVILNKIGITLSPESVATVFAILNVIFRAITKKPLSLS